MVEWKISLDGEMCVGLRNEMESLRERLLDIARWYVWRYCSPILMSIEGVASLLFQLCPVADWYKFP